ncbi:MAG: PAS domain S-box protein [Campylobacterales bacterium]|nr:PAS domain S-box protein [Campylobacterales bacterium]
MNEQELKNNTKLLEEYKRVVDAGAIVSKTDLNGKITYVNDQFCRISGYTREELLGSSHNIVRHPDVPDEVYGDLWGTISRKSCWKGKIKNRAKNGSTYYVTAIIIPIMDDNNNVVEYLALRQDVTELEELNNSLEKRVAEEVEKNRKKDEQSIANLTAFLENSPNPIVVYNGRNIQYANSKFLKLVSKEKAELCGSEFQINSIFHAKVGCISSIEEIDPQRKENKVSLLTGRGINIFDIFVSDIPFLDNSSLKMYTLNNITLIEYQKLKISHYSMRLEDFIKKFRKGKEVDKILFEKSFQKAIVHVKKEVEEEETSKIARVLNNKEKNLLKKSRENIAVSSEDFSADIDDYVLEKNEDLSEIEDEVNELIREFNEEKNFDALSQISTKLLNYAAGVALLVEFEDLSYAINSLGELLQTIAADDLDETKHKKTELYLSNIMLDLSNWRRNVFVEQTTNDIHYLDSSLFSTILQFELIFNKADIIEDEDDFEMF